MLLETVLKYPAVFLVAFISTYLLVPPLRYLACRLGAVDRPGTRRLNKAVVPRAGGLAIVIGFNLGLAVIYLYPWHYSFAGSISLAWWQAFFPAAALLVVVGLLDDLFNLRWALKLLGQTAAALFLFTHGVTVATVLGYDLTWQVDLLATLLWVLALTNAFNLIDGLDGLATGLAAIAALGLSGASVFRGQPADTLVLLALFAACLAFLRFNFNPASVFLGDTGSMFLGFTIAAISLATSTKGTTLAALTVPLLAVGVPVFDTMLAVWRRSVRSLSPAESQSAAGVMQADMEHIHHRLLRSGLSQSKVALSLYGLSLALVTLGLLSLVYRAQAVGFFIVAFVLGLYVIVRHLARVELWDSGTAILQGLRRPSRSVLVTVLYPIFDALALAFAHVAALLFSYPGLTFDLLKRAAISSLLIWTVIPFLALVSTGTYSRVWSRARVSEYFFLALALLGSILIAAGVAFIIQPPERLRLFALQTLTFLTCATTCIVLLRMAPRIIQDLVALNDRARAYNQSNAWRILAYGAGTRGLLFLHQRALHAGRSTTPSRVLGFIDDDRNLRRRFVNGYQVLGGIEELPRIIAEEHPNEIVLCAHLTPALKSELCKLCAAANIKLSHWSINLQTLDTTLSHPNFDIRGKAIRL